MFCRFFSIHFFVCGFLWLLTVVISGPAFADMIIRKVDEEKPKPRLLVLPYVFHTEAMGWAYGIGVIATGYWQEQFTFGGTILGSTRDAFASYIQFKDFQLPIYKRIFFNLRATSGRYHNLRSYNEDNPNSTLAAVAGTNDSSDDDYQEGTGWDNWADLEVKYVLPIGSGRGNPINTYVLDRGLLVSGATGGDIYHPMKSGRSFIKFRFFYHERWFEIDEANNRYYSNGIDLKLEHDNRDFPDNPSKGSLQSLSIQRDFGWFNSDDTWTVVTGDLRKYVSFKPTKNLRQQVIALNLWTADTPSWQEEQSADGLVVSHRPPYFLGATLGGFYRLRGYPFDRFNDRAALYYGAEYRVIPSWFTLAEKWKWLDVAWWQLVGFGELGRVADEWNLKTLHEDMKWVVGVGLRNMVAKNVMRLDVAKAEDSWAMWVMVGQAF